jgi:hypothetical protein
MPYPFEDSGLSSLPRLSASLFARQPGTCISFQAGLRLAGRLWRISRVLQSPVSGKFPRPEGHGSGKLPGTPFSKHFMQQASGRSDYFMFADKRGVRLAWRRGLGKACLMELSSLAGHS